MRLLHNKIVSKEKAVLKANRFIGSIIALDDESIYTEIEDNGELYNIIYYRKSTNTAPAAQAIVKKNGGKVINAFKTDIPKFYSK